MQELNFSITINLSLTLKEDKARINIKNVDLIPAVVTLPFRLNSKDRSASPRTEKRTIHDIILQTAKKYVIDTGQNEFTGAKLFNLSLLDHPSLKRNTFAAQVIAAAPNHPSHRHYPNQKDFFTYLGKVTTNSTKSILKLPKTKYCCLQTGFGTMSKKNTSILLEKMVEKPCPYGLAIFTRNSDSQGVSRLSARRSDPVNS